jgi:purine-binding chemotaxis protein CheW
MDPSTPNRARPLSNPPAALPRNTVAEAPELAEFFLGANERPAKQQTPTAANDPLHELLVFALGAEWYALPVPLLREIVMPPPLSEVPRAERSVLGVTMIRGEVVPVFDVRARLGLSERPMPGPATRVVIVDHGEGPLGIWVDRVLQVLRVRASSLEDPPPGVASEGDAVVRLGRQGERLYGVLDLRLLLHGER